MLCFHHTGSLCGPFRNDLPHTAVQWKQNGYRIDPERFLFPFGAKRYNKVKLHNFIKSIEVF